MIKFNRKFITSCMYYDVVQNNKNLYEVILHDDGTVLATFDNLKEACDDVKNNILSYREQEMRIRVKRLILKQRQSPKFYILCTNDLYNTMYLTQNKKPTFIKSEAGKFTETECNKTINNHRNKHNWYKEEY